MAGLNPPIPLLFGTGPVPRKEEMNNNSEFVDSVTRRAGGKNSCLRSIS